MPLVRYLKPGQTTAIDHLFHFSPSLYCSLYSTAAQQCGKDNATTLCKSAMSFWASRWRHPSGKDNVLLPDCGQAKSPNEQLGRCLYILSWIIRQQGKDLFQTICQRTTIPCSDTAIAIGMAQQDMQHIRIEARPGNRFAFFFRQKAFYPL